ncbi:hypothetical protein C8J57DRAFT_1467393 [Mycena rebaudengoi]|nr:hypothetical protein C8J57DRAFT_1467393 [Mycena rebaudengoi]
MAKQTYQPTATETLGEFVDLLFQRLFFKGDMPLALSTFENDVTADAVIDINGKNMTAAAFLELIKEFHASSVAKLKTIEDLAVVPADPAGRAGVVAQVSTFTTAPKADGKEKEHKSVTIVKVEEREGRRVMTMLAEVQQ